MIEDQHDHAIALAAECTTEGLDGAVTGRHGDEYVVRAGMVEVDRIPTNSNTRDIYI